MNDQTTSLEDIFGPVIHSYTRAQAIADGTLKDVSALASEYGFRIPVAMTIAAWADAVAWDKSNRAFQDEIGRLWDVLTMAKVYLAANKRRNPDADQFLFQLVRVPNTRGTTVPRKCVLKYHIGPGDQGEPVITIMLPNED